MIIDLEYAKEIFKDHVATFTDYGNIKILDFERPKSSEYRIRFLFEEDHYRLHISGDLGELIAFNIDNMTYEGFSDFVIILDISSARYAARAEIDMNTTLIKPKKTFWNSLIGTIGKKKINIQVGA